MNMTGEQIRTRGLAVLRRELGRAGLVKFLQHFEMGAGDFTRQRAELLRSVTMDHLRKRVARKSK